MKLFAIVRAMLVITATLLVGCSGSRLIYSVDPLPTQHLVLIDSLGFAADPTGNVSCSGGPPRILDDADKLKYVQPVNTTNWSACMGRTARFLASKRLGDERYAAYLKNMLASMDAYFAERERLGQPKRVVVFFHGGLNNNFSTLERSRNQARQMMADGYYPIFVNWQSALTVSLLEHLFLVRQGVWRKNVGWAMLAPAYLAGDVGRAVLRAPAVWNENLNNEYRLFQQTRRHELTHADRSYLRLVAAYERASDTRQVTGGTWLKTQAERASAVKVSRADGWLNDDNQVRNAVEGLTPTRPAVHFIRALGHMLLGRAGLHVYGGWTWTPLRATLTPILDGLGTPAWDNMVRHYKLAWQNRDVQAHRDPPAGFVPEGLGAASTLFGVLRAHFGDNSDVEFTLIGHSMGAFMVNEAVQRFPRMKFTNIVYMAAACPANQYEQAAWPYLMNHPGTRWYHLTLNPINERREDSAFLVAPRGSLLMWIDSFFAKPATTQDRTIGRYDNLMPALENTPAEIRGQVFAKTFALRPDPYHPQPQKHGDFADATFRYWRQEFWQPDDHPSIPTAQYVTDLDEVYLDSTANSRVKTKP